MDTSTVPRQGAQQVCALLDSPEITALIADLQATRWTGRPGYPLKAMVGMALVKSVYSLPTWTRTVALVADHTTLQTVLGSAPSVHACYRFATKLRRFETLLEDCISTVLEALHTEYPDMGTVVAVDGSDMPAYANGHRWKFDGAERTAFSDPDASWGHRSSISTRKGGAFYGYKLHAAVCTTTGLPVAWTVKSANVAEQHQVPGLLDTALRRGFHPGVAVMDKGYDVPRVYESCEERNIRPIVSVRNSPKVKAGLHKPPTCEHGTWSFAGSDAKRGASKWRCPTGECTPASVWVKADRLHTLVPRSTKRWDTLYRQRGAVEREFGYLKHEWALLPLRVRRIDRVRLHANLTILTRLAVFLDRARAAEAVVEPLAA